MVEERGPTFVDSTVFLGMHSADDDTRIACKNFFVTRFDRRVSMSFEQIGLCDNFIWQHAREVQDVYYPFMDVLHSLLKFDRQPYSEADVMRALHNDSLRELPMPARLAVAQAVEAQGTLFSLHPALARDSASHAALPVLRPAQYDGELSFPPELEALYRASLRLRSPGEVL
jgi:hypothetical protein